MSVGLFFLFLLKLANLGSSISFYDHRVNVRIYVSMHLSDAHNSGEARRGEHPFILLGTK